MSMDRKNKSISAILLAITMSLTMLIPNGSCSELQSSNDEKRTPDKRNSVSSAPLPQSAPDILRLALDTNGLAISPAKPWHLKISYDQFDEDGDNVHSGTIEEFYTAPKMYKQIYASDALNRVDIANDTGLFRTGDQSWPNRVEADVLNAVLYPLHLTQSDKNKRPKKTDFKLGKSKFPCVTFHNREGNAITLGAPVFCFEPGTAMLRYVQGNLAEGITYDNIVLFQGRYLAHDITIRHIDKPFLKIHVEELDEITEVSEAFFIPSPGSNGPLGGPIPIPSSTYSEEYLVASPQPTYPKGVSGLVHVNYVVGKDGSVIEATANDGPEELRKAVLEAVRKYRFRPYLLLDQPVEVENQIEFAVQSR